MRTNGTAATNGITPRQRRLKRNGRLTNSQAIAINTILSSRRELASAGGYQYGHDRDMYKVLGYKRTLTFEDYQFAYDRGDIAGRIVDAPAQDTWREMPKIVDGDVVGGADDTPFVKAWQAIATDRRLKLLNFLTRADILSRLGHYSVLLIGVAGEGDLGSEVTAGSVKGANNILYLQPYDEQQAAIGELVKDPKNPRFGLPEFYMIDMGSGKEMVGRTKVHWSRVIHIAEDLRRDNLYGTPALRGVFNRLFDLEKTVGGAAEAFWRLAYQGLIISTKDGYSQPSDSDEEDELEDRINDYVNDLRRVLMLDGMEAQTMGGQSVDPSPTANTALDLIAGDTRIPKRILLGSEVGQLASTQDGANYAGYIHGRRSNHAEPYILFEFIDRLIFYGALPPPSSGQYAAKWRPLFEMTDIEKAEILLKTADAFDKVSGGDTLGWITSAEFREKAGLPSEIDLKEIEEFLELEDKTAGTPPAPELPMGEETAVGEQDEPMPEVPQ